EGNPFMVVSDFFPIGFLPRPTVPVCFFGEVPNAIERKKFKSRKWIELKNIELPLNKWHALLQAVPYQKPVTRMHNAVNPKTGSVDGNGYDPYTLKNIYYEQNSSVYIVYDEERITAEEITFLLKELGMFGIGRGATRGKGKFKIKNRTEVPFSQKKKVSVMTLAPCVPKKDEAIQEKSYYKLFTRFGKQFYFTDENTFVHKSPVLTADTSAVFCLKEPTDKPYIGSGFRNVARDTKVVFQGYAPVIGITLEE
ncbi:MAG: hypothetical protein IJC30_02055, partial [Alphaproteobacteria bacterium]|nr:hypothetical protein [Alphaproteobacteria bacterium]